MISDGKKSKKVISPVKLESSNSKLLAVILKKGKRDMSAFKKAFGKYPDVPSVATIRKTAWK